MAGLVSVSSSAPRRRQPVADVTFTKHIAPILQRSCQRCHRPDGGAPMPLITYEQVRPWARSIKTRTGLGPHAGVMPPWFVEKNIGIQGFKQDPSLSDAEIATIAKWVDGGAPRGNAADMPKPLDFENADKWQLGEPDLIVQLPRRRRPRQRSRISGARSAWCRRDSRKIATCRRSKCARSTTFRSAARRRRSAGATCFTT